MGLSAHIYAVQHIRKLRGGSQPHLIRASDGQYYVRYAADPEQDQIFDYLPESMLGKLSNRNDFPLVLAFDKWTCNSDGRQAVFVKRRGSRLYNAIFIDQGYCFNAGSWNFPDQPLRGVYARNSVYEGVTSWRSFEPVLSRIEQTRPEELGAIAAKISEEWYQHDSDGLNRLLNALCDRGTLVRDLITAFRNSSRNPFPNWKVPEPPST